MVVTVANAEDWAARPRTEVTPDTRPADLEITDLVIGEGTEAKADSMVQVRYDAVRADTNAVYESTWTTGGMTVEFPLRSVIDAFSLGIPGMREGGRRILVVPPHLGMGEDGVPPGLPAGVHLVYVVDLVAVGKN